jgi:hypothetical protein
MDVTNLARDLAGVYTRNGYLIGALLDPQRVLQLDNDCWRYLRRRGLALDHFWTGATYSERPPPRRHPVGWCRVRRQAETPTRTEWISGITHQIPAAATTSTNFDLLCLAADLIHATSVELVRSALVYQPARSTPAIPPRATDRSTSGRHLIVWIAIDDQFDGGGSLHLLPASHTSSPAREGVAQIVPLPIGWAAMLNPRLEYRCTANTSDTPRRALVFEYAAQGRARLGPPRDGQT